MLHYPIALPADYRMATIRDRIATRAAAFDAWPGLGWKAFLVRERGVAGATDNQYAPLYCWPDAAAAAGFLIGPFFAGVCEAFGRPAVHTSLLVRRQESAGAGKPRWATVETHPAAAGAPQPPSGDDVDAAALHSAWVSLDTTRWTWTTHLLWTGDAPPPQRGRATRYELAHFSCPGTGSA